MKNITLIAFLIPIIFYSQEKKDVSLEVILKNQENLGDCFVSWAVNGEREYFLPHLYEYKSVEGNFFGSFPLDSLVNVSIYSTREGHNIFSEIIVPSDKITLSIYKDSTEVITKNTNRKYSRKYAANPLSQFIAGFSSNAYSLDALKKWYSKKYKSLLAKDTLGLHTKNRIQGYKELRIADLEMYYLYLANMAINFSISDSKYRTNLKEFQGYLFEAYDPFHRKYFFTSYNRWIDIAESKSKFLSRNAKNKKYNIGLWYNKELHHMNYAPKEVQRRLMESFIMNGVVRKDIPVAQLNQHLKDYGRCFPNSPIYDVLIDKVSSLSPVTKKEKNLYQFSINGLEFIKQVENFPDVISENYKEPYVLVDFWATWCSSCIKEFENKEELHAFLAENNIGMLYVTMDSNKKYALWKRLLEKHSLIGIHYIAGKSLMQEFANYSPLNKEIKYLPRYVLMDQKGKVIHENIGVPSDDHFYQKLKSVIEKK